MLPLVRQLPSQYHRPAAIRSPPIANFTIIETHERGSCHADLDKPVNRCARRRRVADRAGCSRRVAWPRRLGRAWMASWPRCRPGWRCPTRPRYRRPGRGSHRCITAAILCATTGSLRTTARLLPGPCLHRGTIVLPVLLRPSSPRRAVATLRRSAAARDDERNRSCWGILPPTYADAALSSSDRVAGISLSTVSRRFNASVRQPSFDPAILTTTTGRIQASAFRPASR